MSSGLGARRPRLSLMDMGSHHLDALFRYCHLSRLESCVQTWLFVLVCHSFLFGTCLWHSKYASSYYENFRVVYLFKMFFCLQAWTLYLWLAIPTVPLSLELASFSKLLCSSVFCNLPLWCFCCRFRFSITHFLFMIFVVFTVLICRQEFSGQATLCGRGGGTRDSRPEFICDNCDSPFSTWVFVSCWVSYLLQGL